MGLYDILLKKTGSIIKMGMTKLYKLNRGWSPFSNTSPTQICTRCKVESLYAKIDHP